MLDVYPPLANGHPALPYKHLPLPYVHPPMADRDFPETCHHLKLNRRIQETNTKNRKQTQNAYYRLLYTKSYYRKYVKLVNL